MGFFKSFFSGKPANPEEEKQKNNQKNFEIFKYDGMRAQRMGRADYAIKCFTEALALQEDFETMGYLAQVYIQSNELDEARKLLERMIRTEPEHTSTLLTLANVCYMQEDYAAMAEAAKKAIAVDRHVQAVVGLLQAALREGAAGGHGAHAQAQVQAGGQLVLLVVLRAHLAQVLVDQVFKHRVVALEAVGRDVGQVVRNHVQLGLLGGHAGFGNP